MLFFSLSSRKELTVVSPRTTAVKRYARDVVEAIKKEEHQQTLATFAVKLMSVLRSPLENESATMAKRRERMWTQYVYLRATTLPCLWKEFLDKIHCNDVNNERLFMELLNDSLFESLIKDVFDLGEEHQSTSERASQLTEDECNILRYACGYVAMKLQRKYMRDPSNKAATFVECLDHMEVEGPTSSLTEYTRKWVNQTNRGGLFEISDNGYYLFVAIETAMRDKLTHQLEKSISPVDPDSDDGKSAIIAFVTSDGDVQFHWCMVSVDIEDEKHSAELLKEIIKLWLSIRGFSISRAWMEGYKSVVNEATKKKKSLRKALKQSYQCVPDQ